VVKRRRELISHPSDSHQTKHCSTHQQLIGSDLQCGGSGGGELSHVEISQIGVGGGERHDDGLHTLAVRQPCDLQWGEGDVASESSRESSERAGLCGGERVK
jgi:hypothetical protein